MNRLGDANRLITSIDVRETGWEGTGSYIIIFSEATFLELSWNCTPNPWTSRYRPAQIVGSNRSAWASRSLVIADEAFEVIGLTNATGFVMSRAGRVLKPEGSTCRVRK